MPKFRASLVIKTALHSRTASTVYFYSVTKQTLKHVLVSLFKFSNIRTPDWLHTKYEINTVLVVLYCLTFEKVRNRYPGEQTFVMLFREHT